VSGVAWFLNPCGSCIISFTVFIVSSPLQETKGGRSHKKLGFVKLNLAEYAGAGETQRKYLLESYNENKHKPDNSILKVKIALRQTSGDVLFKAPRVPVWELSEAEDEGIQEDLQSMRSKASYNPRVSTTSTLSGLSTGSSSLNFLQGGSLQDMRSRRSSISREVNQRKSCSAGSLRENSSDSGRWRCSLCVGGVHMWMLG